MSDAIDMVACDAKNAGATQAAADRLMSALIELYTQDNIQGIAAVVVTHDQKLVSGHAQSEQSAPLVLGELNLLAASLTLEALAQRQSQGR